MSEEKGIEKISFPATSSTTATPTKVISSAETGGKQDTEKEEEESSFTFTTKSLILGMVGIGVCCLLIVGIIWWKRRRKRNKTFPGVNIDEDDSVTKKEIELHDVYERSDEKTVGEGAQSLNLLFFVLGSSCESGYI